MVAGTLLCRRVHVPAESARLGSGAGKMARAPLSGDLTPHARHAQSASLCKPRASGIQGQGKHVLVQRPGGGAAAGSPAHAGVCRPRWRLSHTRAHALDGSVLFLKWLSYKSSGC